MNTPHPSWNTFESRIDRSNGHVIQSLLDTDTYKLTMQQVFFKKFPDVKASYRFKCRNTDVNLLEFKDEISDEIEYLCSLQFKPNELEWLRKIRFMSSGFIDFLEDFKLKKRFIHVGEKAGKLDIVTDGSLIQASAFEIYVLKIVHEVYTRNVNPTVDLAWARKTLYNKIKLIEEFIRDEEIIPDIADFGGRRAFTGLWHEEVVKILSDNNIIKGTSNPLLAMLYGLTPIGTFAHEFVQTFQGIGNCPVANSQKEAFQTWQDVYRGDLGIALSDTLGDDKFLKDFDMYFAKLFDGLRHDSGDPIKWGWKMIKHYKSMKIDPMIKVLVFSDGLDIPTALNILLVFKDQIKVSFGIGTNLTNDCGPKALQNVMKQTYCNGNPTAKLSNNPAKTMCEDSNFINYLRSVI